VILFSAGTEAIENGFRLTFLSDRLISKSPYCPALQVVLDGGRKLKVYTSGPINFLPINSIAKGLTKCLIAIFVVAVFRVCTA